MNQAEEIKNKFKVLIKDFSYNINEGLEIIKTGGPSKNAELKKIFNHFNELLQLYACDNNIFGNEFCEEITQRGKLMQEKPKTEQELNEEIKSALGVLAIDFTVQIERITLVIKENKPDKDEEVLDILHDMEVMLRKKVCQSCIFGPLVCDMVCSKYDRYEQFKRPLF